MHGLARWRERWAMAGVATIPLWPNSKVPVFGVDSMPPPMQCLEADKKRRFYNIGAITGGPLGETVIDPDMAQALGNVRRGLVGMGYDALENKTASGNRHFWARVADAPEAVRVRRLLPEVGKGELIIRYNVVIPCSQIDGGRYHFTHGTPEDLPGLPVVKWRDLAWLVDTTPGVIQLEEPPIRLVWREMPEHTCQLLAALRGAYKGQCTYYNEFGQHIGNYDTRSGAEFAVICGLVLAGWSFDEIQTAFESWWPGHYAAYKSQRQRDTYLVRSYKRAMGWLAETPERQVLADLYHEVGGWQWPGNGLDLAALQGLIAVGWQFSAFTVGASLRCIAQHASASVQGVSKALKRLQRAKHISKVQWNTDTHAAVWRIQDNPAKVDTNHRFCALMAVCPEVWAMRRLGKSAAMVICHLGDSDGSATVSELATRTGKNPETIRRALKKLAAHGLAESAGGWPPRWRRGPRPLAEVAEALEAEKHARRRRDKHQRERERWQEWMATNRAKPESSG